MSDYSEGSLRVWWVPQLPMQSFTVDVSSVEEALLILDTLGRYDAFQFEHKIKPDYCNAGGLHRLEDAGGGRLCWFDWCADDGDTIDDVRRERRS